MTYWVWLLLLSIMFLRFIHTVACISISLLLWLSSISLYRHTRLIYLFIHWWTFGLFLPFHYCEQYCCDHSCISICVFVFNSLANWSGIAELYSNSTCIFLNNYQTVFHSSIQELSEVSITLVNFLKSLYSLLTQSKLLTVWITTNWKILKEMGKADHLTCLLKNLYAGQEATVRIRHGTDWLQIGKGVHQGCILSPCLFNSYAE